MHAYKNNSTNVRAQTPEELAEAFLSPPSRRPKFEVEEAVFQLAERTEVFFDGERLPVFRFGSGPAVLLLHGWLGSSGQLHAFIPPLLERGMSIVAFDAPAHGDATGTWLAVPRYAKAILRVVESVGPAHGVIAHSMGAAAAAYATSIGLRVQRMVFIGPPANELEFWEAWAGSLGLADGVIPLAKSAVEARVGVPFERLAAQPMAAPIAAPLLVIHDADDREVPWANGLSFAQAAPHGRLLTTKGLGHRRILRDPRVIDASVDFAANAPVRKESTWMEASKPARL